MKHKQNKNDIINGFGFGKVNSYKTNSYKILYRDDLLFIEENRKDFEDFEF